MSGEFALLARLAARLHPVEAPDVGIGDDAAVLGTSTPLLLCTDVLVESSHFDLRWASPADVGWKSVAVNVSDIAAMGGRPLHLTIGVVAGPSSDLEAVYDGVAAACEHWDLRVAGGDLTSGPCLVLSVTATGTTDGRRAVTRSGARPGDTVFVTGALGAGAAGLRLLRDGAAPAPGTAEAEAIAHLLRPRPSVAAGIAAAAAGASAMIDVSDGLAADLGHVADASGVAIELDSVPVHPAATRDEALGGGDDYVLAFTAPDADSVRRSFEADGLEPPIAIGRCAAGSGLRLDGEPLAAVGFEHEMGSDPRPPT